MLLLGFCLFRSKMADLAQKVYERKSVAPAQQADNERKEFLAGTTGQKAGPSHAKFGRFVLTWCIPPLLARGLNEHTNGLVREHFPNGTGFRQVTDAQVKAVQDRTDARPRKSLGYLTPEEAFRKARPP